jgi:hypothetical protein
MIWSGADYLVSRFAMFLSGLLTGADLAELRLTADTWRRRRFDS